VKLHFDPKCTGPVKLMGGNGIKSLFESVKNLDLLWSGGLSPFFGLLIDLGGVSMKLEKKHTAFGESSVPLAVDAADLAGLAGGLGVPKVVVALVLELGALGHPDGGERPPDPHQGRPWHHRRRGA
jgi:hypothetical protein